MPDDYEQRARVQKANRLMEHLWARGHRSKDLDRMHPTVLAHHASSAGVRAPSEETWNMVGSMMRIREREQSREDPF